MRRVGAKTTPVFCIGVPDADKSNIKRWAHTNGGDKRCRGNNWFVPYQTIRSRDEQRPHPATFPVELAEWCIRLPGLIVMDPFLGIGNAAVAARRCEIAKFIGFEIDEEYLAEALDSTKLVSTLPNGNCPPRAHR
jgi:site-specific DNA-methyltransferase (adenine-specific)